MAVTWADVSYYQPVVDDSYPHPVLSIRSNDGTYRDPNFAANYAWAKRAHAQGRLAMLIVYLVWRPNWEQTANIHMEMIGSPPPSWVVSLIDVESWGGQISGNQSDGINRMYWKLADWYGDKRRVLGYGNRSDLNGLWPDKPPGVRLFVASYGSLPSYPGMIAHQYADNVHCPPFGECDANSANDFDDAYAFAAELGVPYGLAPAVLSMDIGDEEHDSMHNLAISGTGRIVLACPTGPLAANKRQAWLSAVVLDLKKPGWVQVYAQGADAGVADWRWTEQQLGVRADNFMPRAVREIPPGVSHVIVSWDITAAPEGGTLCLETKTGTG